MIFLTADHGGWAVKKKLRTLLRNCGLAFIDLGPSRRLAADDYPPLAARLGRAVIQHRGSLGIGVCRSGVGMAMAANKISGIRASQAWSVSVARRSRREENANVLSLGADVQTWADMQQIVLAWVGTPFRPAKRFQRRLRQIDRLDHGR